MKWKLRQAPDERTVGSLSEAIHVNPYLAGLLVQRGITTFKQARDFFRPSWLSLHDPFLMKGMEAAVERLMRAFRNQQKIVVYGDYDVDGTTSVALVYRALQKKGFQVIYYIPDRHTEGYGISRSGVEWAISEGASLLLALDCGIRALANIAYAQRQGLDVLVCDHHEPGDQLPPAYAILDPKQSDCEYPYKELSGCAIGFKLLQALWSRNQWNEADLNPLVQLVAISLASDIVPLTGENRILCFHGLKQIQQAPLPGTQALIQIAGVKGPISVEDIVFKLGPRINAAGRIGHASEALILLLSEDSGECKTLASELNKRNEQRKQFDKEATREAIELITEESDTQAFHSTVLHSDAWHKGVIGIVASRCIEQFYRPTIIFTSENGLATGSARSIAGFDIHQAIGECSDLLEKYGGHQYAAGLSIRVENIIPFKSRFEEVVKEKLAGKFLEPALEIDLVLPLDMLDAKFYRILEQMAPFGPGNMAPVFLSENVVVARSPQLLKGEHLRFAVSPLKNPKQWEVIAFNQGDWVKHIDKGSLIRLVYTVAASSYGGQRYIQLVAKDLRQE